MTEQNKSIPTVSVLTPIYNTDPAQLRQAIDSILGQTYTDFELIILNDSPNNQELEKIVKSYDDVRIIYATNDKNLGISKSRNKLIDMARGKYLAIMDHDDVSLPERLAAQVKFLDENPFYGVVSSNVEWFPKYHLTNYPTDNMDIKKDLAVHNSIWHTAMMIRKSVLDENNIRYEEQYSPAEDYMLAIRLAEHCMMHSFKKPLVKYRWFENNTTTVQSARMVNGFNLARCVGQEKYQYLTKPLMQSKHWVRLFYFIPFLKIKRKGNITAIKLFGFIPLALIRKCK